MVEITANLVRSLLREQFPRWSTLPIAPVRVQGWDNRTFRIGDEWAARLPSAERYAAAVEKEGRWLPVLSPALPHLVPTVVATGRPGCGYPFAWSVRRWLPGHPLGSAANVDRRRLAHDLGNFLTSLRRIPGGDGPAGGRHSFFRGCHPSGYADDVQSAVDILGAAIDVMACRNVWAAAIKSAWSSTPTWFHGDVAAGNLLIARGRLVAVIDFGTCGVGDPACDLVMAWTYFSGDERQIFRDAVDVDDTWRRARGWALWKALATMAGSPRPDPVQRTVLTAVLGDAIVG